MSQYDYGTIDPNAKSGTQLAVDLNNWRDALHSGHRGAERPPYAQAGMLWVRETSAEQWDLMIYDGDTDFVLRSVNPTTNQLIGIPRGEIAGLDQELDGLTNELAKKISRDSATGAAEIPSGTEAQRPASPANGMFRYNSEKHQFEGYQDGKWGQVGGGDAVLTPGWALSRNNIGDGYAAQDGQLLSRATYPDAWAQAQAIGMVITDAEWLADPLKRGFFSSGDGSTTFRLPDANGKQAGSLGAVFLRGDGALSAGQAGLIQRDAFQGHSFGNPADPSENSLVVNDGRLPSTTGASPTASVLYSAARSEAGFEPLVITSDTVNGTPRTASETRPLNITVVWTIKLFGAVVNVGSADAAQLASDYANLAAALQTFESRYDDEVDFTIIYPNGGSAASPANVAVDMRYVEGNPFPGYYVQCQAEIFFGGEWVCSGWYTTQGVAGHGVRARQLGGGDIIIRTGGAGLIMASKASGSNANYTGTTTYTTPTPCRVLVRKLKGAVA